MLFDLRTRMARHQYRRDGFSMLRADRADGIGSQLPVAQIKICDNYIGGADVDGHFGIGLDIAPPKTQ